MLDSKAIIAHSDFQHATVPAPLQPSDTFFVHDSTKLNTYAACARRYFYEYVLGWRLDIPNIHLHAGAAVHVAFERLLRLASRDGGYKPEHVEESFECFLTEYRKHFAEFDDDLRAPKDPTSIRWAMDEYIKFYQLDKFEVLHTEIGGAVPINVNDAGGLDYIFFNIDAIVRDHADGGAIKVIDHKTAKQFSRNWAQMWYLSIQFGTYTHAMRCIFGDDFWGVVVNGIKLSTKPRVKKDGEVYASDRDKRPEFQRSNIRYSDAGLEGWYFDVLNFYKAMRRDFDALTHCAPNDQIMRAFPRNYNACSAYGGCPYHSFCWAWDNPLAHAAEPPAGFKREHWNPADRAADSRALLTFDPRTNTGTIIERNDQ